MKKLNVDVLKYLIPEHAKGDIADGRLCAAEIQVTQDGETAFYGRFGTKNAEGLPLDPVPVYRLASMTKPITAVAVLQQADKGLLDMNAPIQEYLPAFENLTLGHVENGKAIIDRKAKGTVRVYDLLCHTSGIGTWPILGVQSEDVIKITSTKEMADYYADQPVAFDPGTGQGYSASAAFDVAARILEVVTGQPYAALLKNGIFDPLGMCDTTFDPSQDQWDRMVAMHQRSEAGKNIDAPMQVGKVFGGFHNSACAAGAGLISTLPDYVKFAEMLVNKGVGRNGAQILTEKAVQRMATPHVPEVLMGWDVRWGLGVRVITQSSYRWGLPVRSFGWSGAYGTHFWVDPENRVTAVYMKNSVYDGGAGCKTGNQFEMDVSAALK